MCGCNGFYGYCVNELIFKMEINGLKLIKIPCPFSLAQDSEQLGDMQ